MNEIFVSYKRENESRVAKLVDALERKGYSVWWDRNIAGGEAWRKEIHSALLAAKCVIVVWTRESVGSSGDFVREEAGVGKRRGLLVPIKLDKVDPPLGFGEMQAINFIHWKGNPRDAVFEDLCAALTAKLEGRATPPANGQVRKLVRRLTFSSFASGFGLACLAFSLNFLGVQDRVCTGSLFQPSLSDLCGATGMGHRATGKERIAWEGRERTSCAALRAHIASFPQGVYRKDAEAQIQNARRTEVEIWTPSTRQLPDYISFLEVDTAADKPRARSIALVQAQERAERKCRAFTATTRFRFVSALPKPGASKCMRRQGGIGCDLEFIAVCALEERRVQEVESCHE